MTMKISMLLAATFVAGILGAGSARAGADGPCRADAKKLCKGVQRGEGRILACLKEHESELSAACKEKLQQAKEKKDNKPKEGKQKESDDE